MTWWPVVKQIRPNRDACRTCGEQSVVVAISTMDVDAADVRSATQAKVEFKKAHPRGARKESQQQTSVPGMLGGNPNLEPTPHRRNKASEVKATMSMLREQCPLSPSTAGFHKRRQALIILGHAE